MYEEDGGDTPLRMREKDVSRRLMEDMAIREELDLATERELQVVVFMPVATIARGMGIPPRVAERFLAEARRRVIERWKEEERDGGNHGLSVGSPAVGGHDRQRIQTR